VRSPDPLAAALVRAQVAKYPFFSWVRLGRAGPNDPILDVGCGNGWHLERMRRWGFRKLYGVDPYTSNERDEPGLQIRRVELAEVSGSFALIMLHHVLEHVADPADTLRLVRERLQAGGRALVRLPVAGSRLHREYGADWFNLDAPRHLVIPSVEGMGHLARRAGLRLVHTSFDTTETAYWMSDYYRRDIPMKEAPPPEEPIRKRCRAQARAANRQGEGDQGVFVFERS
jgi:SAM-dependent methyltransferase